jgi:hypothetical protein
MMASAAAPAQAQGYVDQIEKLYGAFGGKLTEAQRAQLHAKLAEPGAHGMKEPLEALRKVSPRHLKILKYAFIGAIVVFFVLPFALGILGMILGAVFG